MSRPTTRILPGAPLRNRLLRQIAEAAADLQRPPQLMIVQVGSHPASTVYVQKKMAAAQEVGLTCAVELVPEDAGEGKLHRLLKTLGQDPEITGILLQLPLPAGWDAAAALALIPPLKDVDGLSPENQRQRHIWPATPLGVMRLLAAEGIPLQGQQAVVVGRSALVGAPLAELLRRAGAKVQVVARATPHPAQVARQADVLCVATGMPELVDEHWVKPGAAVIDIGLTRTMGPQGPKLLGDVRRMAVEGVAGALTPVPGGVGPLTVASLLTNVVDAARLQEGLGVFRWKVKD